MNEFKRGDLVIMNNRVFRVRAVTTGKEGRHIPEGFLIDKDSTYHNPKLCRAYKGALSALEGVL